MEDTLEHDERIRLQCLHEAVNTLRFDTTREILRKATLFEDFVKTGANNG